ncbi:hypothetical protein ACFQU1_04725 [Chelatococcus sp. GCM10030263]|uniref:hypothetical protein n=1 Tax=Chelatococcus sp. GCM10030263 TaxID=3273387 RepID=UPI00361496E1
MSFQVSKKILSAGLAGLVLAGSVVAGAGDASARWRGHGPHYYHHRGGNAGAAAAAGIVGGLALGALAAGAVRPAYAGPGPVYDYDPGCYVERRRVWVDGWGWSYRRVTICD